MAVSAEALLISALVNTRDVGAERSYGISAADIEGYSAEYNWCTNYVATYGSQPTTDILKLQFGEFPLVDHTDVRAACDMVHKAANRRRLIAAIGEATDLMHVGDAEQAYQRLVDAKPKRALAKPRDLLTDTAHLDAWDQRPFCIEVPYRTLQMATGGIRRGNLWYLAARPGQGKSAHLVSICSPAVLAGNRILFASLEMTDTEVRHRFHVALAHRLGYNTLSLDALRNHTADRTVYKRLHGEIADRLAVDGGALDVITPADGPVSPSSLAARASEYHLVVVDYVGLMAADHGGVAVDDWRVMAKISNSLKTMALQTGAGLLCAAQINREGETGQNPPKVKNLAQSDALGQDGDVVLTMRAKPHNVATAFSVEKNRHGPSGVYFHTTFDLNHGVFDEISADHADDLVINAEALGDGQAAQAPKLRIIKNKDEL